MFHPTRPQQRNKVENCLDLIKKYNNMFRIRALGIGSGVSVSFLENVAINGKGQHYVVSNLNDLSSTVISALNNAMKPYYNNISLEINNENIKSELSYPQKIPLTYKEEAINCSFITKDKINLNDCLSFKAFDPNLDKEINNKIQLSSIYYGLPKGDGLNKAIISLKLKNESEKLKNEEIIAYSLKYQVLSKLTSLYVECMNEGNILKPTTTIIENKIEVKTTTTSVQSNQPNTTSASVQSSPPKTTSTSVPSNQPKGGMFALFGKKKASTSSQNEKANVITKINNNINDLDEKIKFLESKKNSQKK